jgi:hypothetical protein
METARKISVFSDEEAVLISVIHGALQHAGKHDEIQTAEKVHGGIQHLVNSIRSYPSIMETHQLAGAHRSIESLVKSLCDREFPDMIMRIPTKGILGRAYTIAKINYFIMLRFVVKKMPELRQYDKAITDVISRNVFVMTAEEVFISIVEDSSLSMHLRHNAAYLLARTWEYRLDYGVREFAPILQKLWQARGRMNPIFGTLMGFSELFILSEDTESRWYDFLQRDELSDDEVSSLEEFIFGLSFEELCRVREHMLSMNRSSVTREQVMDLLGSSMAYPEYESDDPRELYRSFRNRKNHGRYRQKASLSGPKKTFEEYLMCFLLMQPDLNTETGICSSPGEPHA